MKKRKQQPPKPKEFAPAPFALLKGVKVLPDAPRPAPSVPKESPKLASLDDSDAFLLAMAGVQRLGAGPKTPAAAEVRSPQKAVVRRIEEGEQQLFLEAIAGMKLDVRFEDELPEETTEVKLRSVSRLKQLRRGTIRIDYELDLHGLTREEALDALAVFVKGAYRRGQQAVLVITGRGNHSAEEPVLKKAVDKWLRETGSEMVAEFLSAPRQMGGEGAVVVFLRKQSETPAGRD
jgi:DNA-nicking Smr family endonuclease